jgi:hypothetical protein
MRPARDDASGSDWIHSVVTLEAASQEVSGNALQSLYVKRSNV